MYPKTYLHLNSKQSGQLMAAVVGVSLIQYVVNEVKARRSITSSNKYDHVLIKENPETGLVTALTVEKNGQAKQYSWNHKK